jgi:hypothetical protein
VPAPAVIPALIAYVKVVAVKTLVVGTRSRDAFVELGAVVMGTSVFVVAAECCWDFSRVPNRPGREPCGRRWGNLPQYCRDTVYGGIGVKTGAS